MSVAGVRLTQNPLHDIVSRVATQCSDDSTDCYLVDDGAVIVYTNSTDDKVLNNNTITNSRLAAAATTASP